MSMVFVSKLRPIGSSACVIVPKEVLEQEGLKMGEELTLSIVSRDFSRLEKLFGSAKGAKPFVRDRRDRI